MTAPPPTYLMPPTNPLSGFSTDPVEMLPAWDDVDLPGGIPGQLAPCPMHPDAPVDFLQSRGHPWLTLEERGTTVAITLHTCSHPL